jgi:pimeloyl-ACP methyl ester carboxylesterase
VPFSWEDVGTLMDTLMNALGYSKYFAQGGDWGAVVVKYLALLRPERCRAIRELDFSKSKAVDKEKDF